MLINIACVESGVDDNIALARTLRYSREVPSLSSLHLRHSLFLASLYL